MEDQVIIKGTLRISLSNRLLKVRLSTHTGIFLRAWNILIVNILILWYWWEMLQMLPGSYNQSSIPIHEQPLCSLSRLIQRHTYRLSTFNSTPQIIILAIWAFWRIWGKSEKSDISDSIDTSNIVSFTFLVCHRKIIKHTWSPGIKTILIFNLPTNIYKSSNNKNYQQKSTNLPTI